MITWIERVVSDCAVVSNIFLLFAFKLPSGFVQSLEFLKKYGNLQTSFPDLEKVGKIEIKSNLDGKN